MSKKSVRSYTSKQMGDACEMLIAAELTLAGFPAAKMPDNWPHYDVVAQPQSGGPLQRVSVKSRTFKRGASFVAYDRRAEFDWLAVVLLPGEDQTQRRSFVVPRHIADARSRKDGPTAKTQDCYWRQDEVAKLLREFENNFALSPTGTARAATVGVGTQGQGG
jgi:hypothetical protein